MTSKARQHDSPWPHRAAMLLAVATFPLIWVGGLVTTTDAGMAVPDWPSTYGYNLFLYPWETWFFGPWDLFIEHGHRLLGALTGLLSILLCAAVWRYDRRPWMRSLVACALALVIFQGALGGARVLLDARRLAFAHGCVGPAFFALASALVVFTSPKWRAAPAVPGSDRLSWHALRATMLIYLQLVLGALVRHVPVDAAPGYFRAVLLLHLLLAAGVVLDLIWLACNGVLRFRQPRLAAPAAALGVLALVQPALGCASYVVKYGFPDWLGELQFAAGYTVIADDLWSSCLVTAHVALGSLLLVLAVTLALRAWGMTEHALAAKAWRGA